MSTLKLYLSPLEGNGFKVIVASQGETESELPFFEGEKDWRTTVLRCLEMTYFNSKYFPADEQEWMVASGILDDNRQDFDANYLANIGQKVYQALFPRDSKAKGALLAALRAHEAENNQLHIQLMFAADVVRGVRLADYPWELLHDGATFLLHHNLTISRYIAYEGVPPNLPPTDKVNVLLVSSTASDPGLGLKQLDEQEAQAIRKGLAKASNAGHINFVQLEEATRDTLRAYLTEHRGNDAPHVLHFDGHGLFGKRCSNPKCRTMHKGNKVLNCRNCHTKLPEARGYMVFEDGNGGADYVSADELGQLMSKSSLGDGNNKSGGIALVVLSACQSAMAVEGDSVFNGTAQNLISQRIPSVVAMQYSVAVVSATRFAEQFYRSLGQKNSLGIAVSQAREAMGIEGNQWYRPVLYLRWADNEGGQLFQDAVIVSEQTSQNSPLPLVQPPKNELSSNFLNLNNVQKKKLREALINAFPTEADLEMMLDDELGIALNTIASGKDYTIIMRNVVTWFESQGQLLNLINAALKANLGNPQLKAFAQDINLVDI